MDQEENESRGTLIQNKTLQCLQTGNTPLKVPYRHTILILRSLFVIVGSSGAASYD